MLFSATILVTLALPSECHVLFSTSSFLVNKEIKPRSNTRIGRGESSDCQFPFIYKGVNYLECTTEGDPDGKRWCSTKTDDQNNHIKGNWVHCRDPDKTESTRIDDQRNCTFPFIYKSISYSECTTTGDPDGKLWCSIKTDSKQNHIKGKWKHCVQGPSYCQFPFIYKSVSYSKCTTEDDPDEKLWCSTKTDHQNSHIMGNYDYCSPDERPVIIPTVEDGCGLGLSNFVVYGEQTAPHEYPWLVSIGRKTTSGYIHRCGGTLITKYHVISASHCFTKTYDDTVVRLGEFNVNDDGDDAEDFKIVDTRRIGTYIRFTKENDIILLKLDRPIDSFTDAIRPACLPYHLKDNRFGEEKLGVVGWGAFNQNDVTKTSPIPLKGYVKVVPLQECQAGYKDRGSTSVIDDRQLCAGTGGTDTCKGDSGGPISYLDPSKGRFYVVGIVSFGPPVCGHEHYPEVYTMIIYFLKWIEKYQRNSVKVILSYIL